LKIVVCVKQVPDSAAAVVVEDGKVTWGDAPLVINPWDEYAVEAALQLTESQGGDVVALSMGDENSKDALKHALAMGCSEAVLINDPALAGCDAQGAARILAAAVQKVGDADAVIFGKQAIDSDTGIMAPMVARVLGWPALTLVSVISGVEGGKVKVERAMEEGRQVVEGKLPAVLSIVKDYGEPRYPSFMGIRKASKAEIPEWTAGDLGIDPPGAAVSWPEVMNPPASEVTNEIIEGDSPEDIAAKLADKIMEEKVL
jgi:electron transfer flavoprotein beta subunit